MDNLLLEAQDATERSSLMLYEGARRLPEIDAALGGSLGSGAAAGAASSTAAGAASGSRRRPAVQFTREYCEWNTVAKTLREVNCLYRNAAHPHAAWLWATGNRQMVAGRWGSIVSYGLTPCWLRPMRLATDLYTSPSFVGERLRSGPGRARQAQLAGLSPLKNESALAMLRGAASSTGRAPAAVVDEQRRFCEKHSRGATWA